MNKSFFNQLCRHVECFYAQHLTQPCESYEAQIDSKEQWIEFSFCVPLGHKDSTVDARKRKPPANNLLYIRRSGKELIIDFYPGATDLPICMMDDYGLRWIAMTYGPDINLKERRAIESFVKAAYQLAQTHQSVLHFILGHEKLCSQEKAPGC